VTYCAIARTWTSTKPPTHHMTTASPPPHPAHSPVSPLNTPLTQMDKDGSHLRLLDLNLNLNRGVRDERSKQCSGPRTPSPRGAAGLREREHEEQPPLQRHGRAV
jgi:hypothetical protein